MNTVEIKTGCGDIRGIDFDKHYEFRGIKYATAGRWEHPAQVKKWDGVYDATEFGECSYQRRGFEEDEKCNAFYHKEFRRGMSFKYSEDCLFLNIWAPKNADGCPVIIYIHGGSFTGGSANEGHISGRALAERGVIFVAMNYRLGPFGFCSHPELTVDGSCGNYGLFDQLTAIKWVKDNISSFGGNGDNITLLGQSAGAMSVDILVSSPLCSGMAKNAVMMSGVALQRAVLRPCKPERTRKFWDTIISNAGVSSIEELRGVNEKTLFYAWSDACSTDKLSALYTLPVCDGALVTADTYNMNNIPDMPYILGVTDTDMAPIALELITKRFAKKVNKYGKCYIYNFDRHLPGDDSGAWHSCDLLYSFGTLQNNWRPFDAIDYIISEEMMSMLVAFAASGNPNCDAIPEWKPDYKMPLHFAEKTYTAPWNTKSHFSNTFGNKGAEF